MGRGRYRAKTKRLPLTRGEIEQAARDAALLDRQRKRRRTRTQTDRLEVEPDLEGLPESADQARLRFSTLTTKEQTAIGPALKPSFAVHLDATRALYLLAEQFPVEYAVFVAHGSGTISQRDLARRLHVSLHTIRVHFKRAQQRLRDWCSEDVRVFNTALEVRKPTHETPPT